MFTNHRLAAACLLAPLALMSAPTQAQPANQPNPNALPLQRVTLYSSGVGYFEHAGPITANATPTFRFTDTQLNDVLKSLLVRGANGHVAVGYPGQEPIGKRLAGFGIDLSNTQHLAEVLEQLRGIPLILTIRGGDDIAGRLIGVQERDLAVDERFVRHTWLTLATENGLRRLSLEQVDHVQIQDDALNAELNQALTLLGSTRQRDAKPLTLTFADASDQVAVSYLLETPLWKLTYRLDLSQEQPLLQAWAIVDNTTDADWNDIQISLVSGRPVSFIQNLYAPEYLQRPVVNPERFAGLRPQDHDQAFNRSTSSFGGASMAMDAAAEDASELAPQRARMLQRSASAPAATPVPEMANFFNQLESTVTPAANATDLGALFAYHLDQPVTLPRGGSAMLPILNADIKAAPVSVYNANAQRQHPMLGVSIRNTTDLKLDAGPVTVLDDGAYAGDAKLGFLAPEDARLLTYGLDLEVTVDPSQSSTTQLVTATIARGVLVLNQATQFNHTYAVRNAANAPRQLLIEHPRNTQRKLIQPATPTTDQAPDANADAKPALAFEQTETHYRFPLTVPAGQTAQLDIIERQPRVQSVQLLRQNADQLAVYVRNGDIPKPVREALAYAVAMQRDLQTLSQQITELDQQVNAISEEQNRIRNNMSRLDRNNALFQRYVEKLDAQETQLEKIGTQAEQLRDQRAEQQQELTAYLESLDVE